MYAFSLQSIMIVPFEPPGVANSPPKDKDRAVELKPGTLSLTIIVIDRLDRRPPKSRHSWGSIRIHDVIVNTIDNRHNIF